MQPVGGVEWIYSEAGHTLAWITTAGGGGCLDYDLGRVPSVKYLITIFKESF
jgi:hypothetical protein